MTDDTLTAQSSIESKYRIMRLFTILLAGYVVISAIVLSLVEVGYLQEINIGLEVVEHFISFPSLIIAAILVFKIAKRQQDKTDSWYYLLIAIWCLTLPATFGVQGLLRNIFKYVGIYEVAQTYTLYQFIMLFDHYFEVIGAVFIMIWLYKLYSVVYKHEKPKVKSFTLIYKLFAIIFGIYIIIFGILVVTGNIADFTAGHADEILDNFERVINGPAFLALGIVCWRIIVMTAGKAKGWTYVGIGFIAIGIDRGIMSGGQSILRYLYGTKIAETMFTYWLFEIGDHYWASLVLFMPLGLYIIYKTMEKGEESREQAG